MNKVKQAQIFLFLTIGMMAFWMFVATGYLLYIFMKEYTGGCHCGGVKYKFKSDQSVEIWNCNCSICDMINYQHLFVKHELFELISGDDLLLEYKFESGSAKHFFCKRCGIKSFYQPRSHPEMYSINLKCVDDPPEIKEVIYFDGINFEESIKNI